MIPLRSLSGHLHVALILGCFWLDGSVRGGDLRRGEIDLQQLPKLQSHYQPEFTFDTNTDAAAWRNQGAELHVAFGSTDELYLRCEVPQVEEKRTLEIGGWRGERLNAQVLVWSGNAQEQVRVETSEPKSDSGKTLGPIKPYLVRYVVSNFPYQAKGFSCEVTNNAAFLMPDRLDSIQRFDLPARTVRPLWLPLDIPQDAEPGHYRGTVEIRSSTETVNLSLNILVQPQVLPPPSRWKFRLDLWQNPAVVSAYFQVRPWSAEHLALLRAHLKPYAEAGGKFITTYAVHSPCSDNITGSCAGPTMLGPPIRCATLGTRCGRPVIVSWYTREAKAASTSRNCARE